MATAAVTLLVLALGVPHLVQGRTHQSDTLTHSRTLVEQGARMLDSAEGPSLEELQRLVAGRARRNLRAQTGSRSAARFLVQMYRRLEEGEDLAHAAGHTGRDPALLRADTVRSLPANTETNRKISRKTTLTFDLSAISRKEATQRAELRIRPARRWIIKDGSLDYRARVSIFDGGTRVQKLTFLLRSDNVKRDGFVVLDLTQIVKHVVEAGYHKATMDVRLKRLSNLDPEPHGRSKRSRFPVYVLQARQEAMLVIFTRDKHFFQDFRLEAIRQHLKRRLQAGRGARVPELAGLTSPRHGGQGRRDRRSSPRRQEKTPAKSCQVQDLYVDFNQIGWGEWIVYPKRFNAYQCTGRCPVPVDQSYDPTNHAVLQSLMRVRERGAGAARPCCVPAKLSAITMLYYEQEVVVVRHHEDMVVDACACR